tara:strand:+ start:1518 stop:2789 length:1272 start_codon:yes stop_codon:yes gene_type:complete
MTIKKGLRSLAENTPNFSNQSVENAINDIKAVDKDDGHQFILSQFLLDEAIRDNTVLTTSQKNDVLDTLYNAQPHLQIGRYLNDVIRHTNTIIDGSIIPLDDAANPTPSTFLEILQNVQTIQGLVPDLLGISAAEQKRSVNDHLGILNGIFLSTTDSTAPVFTRLKEIMQLIDTNSRTTSALNTAVTNAAVANLNLRTFINGVVADSTDFQTTLDNRVNSVVTMFSTLNTRISEIPGDPTVDLASIREEINVQVALENSNLSGIIDYIDTLTSNISFSTLAEDVEMRELMTKVAGDPNWQSYFREYEQNQNNLNPIYTTESDLDKDSIIEEVLSARGLPDVTDSTNFQAVVNKARRDSRIDTANFDRLSAEEQIIKSCEQLGITTANRTISSLSNSLLKNLNKHDRDTIAKELDLNQSSETHS